MHEKHKIEKYLKNEANRISKELGHASVVIIAGGDTELDIPRTMTASSLNGEDARLQSLLGLLQASIQIESKKHFDNWE